jgi:hypothetical protein
MADYTVQVVFLDNLSNTYTFPLVQSISDPAEGMKATVIEGNRSNGSIIIPGGKRSQEISVRGIIFDNDGYVDITTKMDDMRSKVTTNPATLTIRHWNGSTWVNDRVWNVRRVNEITFADSMRTTDQNYEVRFLVITY